ncbi:MAG: glycosyltransferase family 2 protein [Desulfovibrio sp.]|jgi:GT2 family glycosyltransferase|nr:glycosyltransferase family 2 protein [Desulfovibrio sp.]
MPGELKFSVVSPVYNKCELTCNCIRSLREHTPEDNFEVIIIDNASQDETPHEVPILGKELFGDRFIYLRQETNLNFGPASNVGAEYASAPLLLFQNNDTIFTQNWFTPLEKTISESNRLCAVGPLLLYPDNSVQHLGATYSPGGFTHLYQGISTQSPLAHKNRRLQIITAACMLIPTKFFNDLGKFYEGYINGFEDVDLCARIGLAGGAVFCNQDSVVYHLESQTPGRRNANNERHNGVLLQERYGDYFVYDKHLFALDDGLDVYINEIGTIGVCEALQTDMELRAGLVGTDLLYLIDTLRVHPFWLWGIEKLISILEGAKHYVRALPFIHMLCDLDRKEIWYKRYLMNAYNAKDKQAAQSGKLEYERFVKIKNDGALLYSKIKNIYDKAINDNDEILANLYSSHLKKLEAQVRGQSRLTFQH